MTHRIPPSDRGESSSVAARVRPRLDVVEPCEAPAVQPGVEPAERVLAVRNQIVIQQRDNARYSLYMWSAECLRINNVERRWGKGKTHRRRAARSHPECELSVDNNREVERLRRDVGNAAAHRAAQITK